MLNSRNNMEITEPRTENEDFGLKKKVFFAFLFLSIGNISMISNHDNHYPNKFTPPGTVLIASNLYIDDSEVTNFNWLEYLYWTERTFSDSSLEYKALLPNENLWLCEDSCIQDLAGIYLRHNAYHDFPLVGITQKQAESFCKWRSDRVFQYFLIKKKVLEWDMEEDSDNYFTIEKYFAGEYKDIKPDPRYTTYPVYRLPTESEWNKSQRFFDSIANENSKRMKIFQNKKLTESYLIYYDIMPCSGDIFIDEPTHNVIGINMYGNVSEWLLEKDMIIGGNWKTKRNNPQSGAIKSVAPAVTTGFRCVCEFKNTEF